MSPGRAPAAVRGPGLARRTVRLLLDRGLVSAGEVHRHGLTARDVSESNGVVLVELGNGRGFAGKDTSAPRDGGQGDPAREIALLRAAADLPGSPELLAPMLLHDPDQDVLVLDGLVAARRLDRVPPPLDPLRAEPARLFGGTLGRWHRLAAALRLAPARPWVWDLDGDGAPAVLRSDAGLAALVREFSGGPERAVLRDTRAAWSPDTVVHGDVRFANVLVRSSPPSARLVDWECAGTGDSAWDVAGGVQEYLSAGAVFPGSSASDDPVGAFLDGYATGRGGPVDPDRLAAHLGARLLMRALQLSTWLPDPRAEVDRHRALAVAVAAGTSPALR